ncbi:alpha/beta fold hydrolase [Dokdonella sp.]|uniref:alpha/beta hydrolase n=1 Tax=Dokdonella sp. TaxID=2291710 RepID=UPI0027B9F5D5|nr:alpha/beta fold hydrolase [Dokdonella sp.]
MSDASAQKAFEAGPLLLPGPVGTLELACNLPDGALARSGMAIIAHPHPLHGGTMHNKVVTMVERALLDLGLATVRFNFRGVGQSEGVHDDGVGETDDLVAIAQWLRAQRPGDALWLAGFSFGSYVTLRAAPRLLPAQVVLIAPPVGRWDFAPIAAPTCPWLIVQGEEDEVVDAKAVLAWAQTLQPAPQVIAMPETGHYFHRRLVDLRGALRNALSPHLPPAA